MNPHQPANGGKPAPVAAKAAAVAAAQAHPLTWKTLVKRAGLPERHVTGRRLTAGTVADAPAHPSDA